MSLLYIGSITNTDCHKSKIKLDFLDDGAQYVAKVFADGKDAHYKSNPYPVSVSEFPVTSASVLDLNLAEGGAAAVIISKK